MKIGTNNVNRQPTARIAKGLFDDRRKRIIGTLEYCSGPADPNSRIQLGRLVAQKPERAQAVFGLSCLAQTKRGWLNPPGDLDARTSSAVGPRRHCLIGNKQIMQSRRA